MKTPHAVALMKTKFYSKYPRSEFKNPTRNYYRSLEAAKSAIETVRPGYTSEPWIQLVRMDDNGWEVVAEWEVQRQQWVSIWAAAGFVSRRVA